MRKRVRGLLKNAGSSEPAATTTPYGYREPWKTGKAPDHKKLQRIGGPNWPSI